jgi:hypothetical protein
MIKMVNDFCAEDDGYISEFEPMMGIFEEIDCLVDIMNGQNYLSGKNLNVSKINNPQHVHVYELFNMLKLFTEWKDNAGRFSNKFITKQLHEDLVWMIFGLAGV